MPIISGRRLPGFVAALTPLLLIAPPAAHAAPADQISVVAENVLVPTGPSTAGAVVTLANAGDADVALHNLKVVVDASGLGGVAAVAAARPTFGGTCDTAGTTVTCVYDHLNVSIIDAYPVFLDLKAATGGEVGESGTYRVTAEADDLPARTATGTVTVAEAVNLVAGDEVTLSGPAGSTLALTPAVRNAGTNTVRGAVLLSSSGSRTATYRPEHSNCVYTDVQFYCVFDEELAAGKQYAPAGPISVVLGGDTPAPSTFETYAEWATPDDAARWMESIRSHGGKAGSGSALGLVEKASAAQLRNPQTDPSAVDNFTHVVVEVTGENPPDLAAVQTTVRGAAGETVAAEIGVKNLGPARIDGSDRYPSAHVVLPPGTTAVEVDGNCIAASQDNTEYRCLAVGLAVGETATWDIALRVDDASPSTGKITARTETAEEGVYGPDRDASNDAAALLLNPVTPPGGTDGDGDGGTGGGLPITGANATYAATAGVVLMLIGAGAYLAARRRRTRYVA